MRFLHTVVLSLIALGFLGMPSIVEAVSDQVIVTQEVSTGTTTPTLITICHTAPNPDETIMVPEDELAGYLAQGSYIGECVPAGGPPGPPPRPFQSQFKNLRVFPSHDSVRIVWNSVIPARARVSWGETVSYELGTISESSPRRFHSIIIDDLTPDTQYFFDITMRDVLGITRVLGGRAFRTLPLPDTFPPQDPRRFRAVERRNGILLTWRNPPDLDFEGVRIVRSETGFIRDPQGGRIIFDGDRQRFVDRDVERRTTYYYTIFAYDEVPNYSEGAIVSIRTSGRRFDQRAQVFDDEDDDDRDEDERDDDEDEEEDDEDDDIEEVSLEDFTFTQNDEDLEQDDDEITTRRNNDIRITIDRDDIPEGVESLILTIDDGRGGRQSSAFSIGDDPDEIVLETTIDTPSRRGEYPFTIILFDDDDDAVQEVEGIINKERRQESRIRRGFRSMIETISDSVMAAVTTTDTLLDRVTRFLLKLWGTIVSGNITET